MGSDPVSPPSGYGAAPYYEPANYAYQYAVKDDYFGVDFKADESRAAEKTAGSYQVLLPDGRIQTVVYKVNGETGGYEADVSYNGEPVFPAGEYAPASPALATPSYKTVPIPTTYPSAPSAPAADPAPAPTPAAAPAEAKVPSYTPAPPAKQTKVVEETKTTEAPSPSYRQGPAYPSQYRPSPSYRSYSPARASTVYGSRLTYKSAP